MSGKDELLDKAIVEAKEAEDWQLVEWLRTARGSESAARWYSDKLREAHRAERKLLAENAKLRELVRGLKYCAHEAYGMCARVPVGGERPFTCCPLYDFDAKKYRCEEFMLELGIEVGE